MKINEENLKNLSKQSLLQYQKLFPVLTKEKNRQYGMLGLTFITVTIFAIFAINPTLTTIAELQKTAEDARFVDEKLTQKIASLQSLRQQYDGLQSDLIFVERAVPDKPLPVQFIGQVQAIANTSSVQLSSFQIDSISLTGGIPPALQTEAEIQEPSPPKKHDATSYKFTLGVSGTYPQVREFLTILTGFDRVTTVDSINVSRDSTGTPIVSLDISGTTFYTP
jgi:Tfp pilus assembly protein PilO